MGLTKHEFFNLIKDEHEKYIVRLAYKYDWEKEYDISNEILEWDDSFNNYVWLNDWNEGQSDVYVLGFIKVSDVIVPDYETKLK